MAIHESLNLERRTGSASDTVGRWIPVADRVGASYLWTVVSDVGDIESGSVTVRVEGAPVRDEAQVVTLHQFAARSAPIQESASVTLSGYLSRGFVRTVANVNGVVTQGTREEAALFSFTALSGTLATPVQGWGQAASEVARAENDLLMPYRCPGGYSLRMDAWSFPADVRDAIAAQVEHRFQLWALGRAGDPASKVTLRQMDAVDRAARLRVARYAPGVYL